VDPNQPPRPKPLPKVERDPNTFTCEDLFAVLANEIRPAVQESDDDDDDEEEKESTSEW
jgi:hypothetical protein